ncbi:M13 family metallopeptidase [Ferruginibacter sp.]
MSKYSSLLLCAVSAIFFACNNETPDTAQQIKGLSMQNIDSSKRPGDDFYMYANGKWYDTATILPTESRAGARLEMDYVTKAHIKSILEESAAATNTAGSIEQKVGDMFASGMDTTAIEKAGYTPLKPWIDKIAAIKDTRGLLQYEAEQQTMQNPSIIGQYIGTDEKNSTQNIAVYYQAGLGLPDRDYYFKTDPATQDVVNAYKTFVNTLFKLTGDDSATAAKNTAIVYDIEKQMATSHRTNVELRDPQTNYNKMAVADLDKKMPAIGWNNLLNDLHVKADSVNVGQPGYYAKLNELLKTVPLENWKTYMRLHLLTNTAWILSSDFVMASFNYNGKALSGQKKLKDRWERIYQAIDGSIGEALGQLYVKKYFSEAAKKKMLELVNNLQVAFENRITKLDWMSDSTKQKAIAKLHTFIKKIAFPDKWRDYSKVTIQRNDYFGNIVSSSKNAYEHDISKIGQPVDKTEWGMTPPTNNAYYNPGFNEIVFPAGILLYPMFDINSDDAMNYGGIGVVIGHEMTHGFDDQGAQFDKDGNLKNWWAPEDFAKFKAKGEQVVKLYNSFVVLDSVHVNGSLTQGENTADIGGVAIAYDAFKMTQQGKDTVKIQGLTPDQRFFLAFAQSWRKKIKDEAMRQQINTDPHSPAMYRIRGPLTNFDPFYTAFGIKEGDKLFIPQKDRIHIW